MPFADRKEAGHLLARQLAPYWEESPIVLALPRGGVVVAAEIARVLDAPLDVLLVRKLATPWNRELAFGALAEGGAVFLDREMVQELELKEEILSDIASKEAEELQRRAETYRPGRPMVEVSGRTVILVDDGIATGSTVQAALQTLEQQEPTRIILAVPVAPPEAVQTLSSRVERVICLETPENYWAVSQVYESFPQVDDAEVIETLRRFHSPPMESMPATGETRARRRQDMRHRFEAARRAERDVVLELPDLTLRGTLSVPSHALGVVVFADAGNASMRSSRHRQLVDHFRREHLGVLCVNLLAPEELAEDAVSANHRFDIALLSRRLLDVTTWLLEYGVPRHHHVGYFVAGTAAAAALTAAAKSPELVQAIVCRSGRPDLAIEALPRVRAPTQLLVGGDDDLVIDLNRAAINEMTCEREFLMVPHASHFFEEAGAIEHVAEYASNWFCDHFRRQPEQYAPI